LNEKGIACRVSQAIVDHLELVDVDEQNRELRIGVASRDGHGPPQAVEKENAVGQVGQAVMKGVVRQHVLGALSLSDIAVDDYQTISVPVCSANNACSGLKNAPGAILVAYAVFEPFSPASETGFLGGLEHAVSVVGMDLFQWRGGVQLVLAIAEDFLIGGTVVEAMSVSVDYRDHIRGIFADELKKLITLGQLATNTLELQVLIDGVDVEQQYQRSQPSNPLLQVQRIFAGVRYVETREG